MTQQKGTLFDKPILIFVQMTKIFEEKTSDDLSVETLKYSKRKGAKLGMKIIKFTTKVFKFSNLLFFQQHSPNFGPFEK